MASRLPMRRRVRSPYSGSLFVCPRECGCPDCRMRLSRSAAWTVTWLAATIGMAVAIYFAINVVLGG